jgi:hypothetical protein
MEAIPLALYLSLQAIFSSSIHSAEMAMLQKPRIGGRLKII